MASNSNVTSKRIRYNNTTLPDSNVGLEPLQSSLLLEVVNDNNNSDANNRPVVGGEDRRQIGRAFRSHGSLQVIDGHEVSREVVVEKELEKAAGDFTKLSMKEKKNKMKLYPDDPNSKAMRLRTRFDVEKVQVPALPGWPTQTLKLSGGTTGGDSDHGCNHGKKDLLSSIGCNTSTSPEGKKSESTPVQISFPSLPLSPSREKRAQSPTTLVESGNKKKKRAQSSPPTSLELKLAYEPWNIKKKLTETDVGNNYRLLIPQRDVDEHIKMDPESTEAVKSEGGMGVIVADVNTDSEHNLVFKYLSSLQGYILRTGWMDAFVKRRNLKAGDEVGLLWDNSLRKFYFWVLHRAVHQHPQA